MHTESPNKITFLFGLQDSFNPFTLAVAVLFVVFLFKIGTTKLAIFWGGLSFLTFLLRAHVPIAMGVFDKFFARPIVSILIYCIFLLVAIIFMTTGLIHFRQWLKYKKGANNLPDNSPVPVVSKKGRFFYLPLIFLSMLLGTLAAILLSIWPPNYRFFVNSYTSIYNGAKEASVVFFIYGIGFIFPLVISWIIILIKSFFKSKDNASVKKISTLKIIYSAVLFAAGLSLLIMIYKSYKFI